jgi:hypothetical protein
MLICLVKHPNVDSHAYHLVLLSVCVWWVHCQGGGDMSTKLVELFANRVVERRNMINNYLSGRACIESVRESWFQGECWFWVFLNYSLPFCLALPLFLPFIGFYGCPSSRWPSWAFLGFLDLLAVLRGVLDSNFKLCAFVINGLIKGEIEKPSGQFLGLIVMSHWPDDVWIRIHDNFVLFSFIFVSFGESCLLISWCVGVAWCAARRIVTGVGDLVQRIRDGHTDRVLGDRACGDEKREFLGWASKQWSMVCEWFGLKTTWTIFTGSASKSVVKVSGGLA